MSLPVRAAGLTPDANGTLPSRPCTPDRTRRPLRCRCTEVFQPGETSNAHAAVHHTALPHRPTRSRFESLPLQSRRPEEQSLNSCKRQTVADHGNHQSGDRTRNWPVSYSETGLNKRRSNADPHAAMTLQTARSTTHVRRPTISHSGHKSGHRACRRAIPYSESRVTRCTREHALRQEWRNFLRLGDGDIDIFPSCDTPNKEVLPRERGGYPTECDASEPGRLFAPRARRVRKQAQLQHFCPASAGVCLCTCSGHCSAQDLAPAGITRKRPALKRRLFVFWRDVHFALFLIWSHSMLRTST